MDRMERIALGFSVLIVLFAYVLFYGAMSRAMGQEHIHGVTVPDWYDPECCNRRDCAPVADEHDIEPMRLGAEPAFKHLPSGLIFTRERFKASKDERYHVCIFNGQPLCIYIPALG